MRAHAFEITVNARICFSTRMRVCALAEDIFALARSSGATTKNLPILGHRAGFNPRPYTRVQLRYPPSCSIVQDGSIFRYRCDRRWAAGFIGFPREMNFARSIVPNYAPCLATNYALPFISSSFVSFFSFFFYHGINEVKKMLLLTRMIYILLF